MMYAPLALLVHAFLASVAALAIAPYSMTAGATRW